jgi:hypothetical protein
MLTGDELDAERTRAYLAGYDDGRQDRRRAQEPAA